jgi:hypothetical protein
MFTLEQTIFIVQCYFRNGERLENGEWSYSTPRVFEEFQHTRKFQDTFFPIVCLLCMKLNPLTIRAPTT